MPDEDHTWPPAPIRPPPPKTTRCPNCGTDNLPDEISVCPICSASIKGGPPSLFASLCGLAGLLLMCFGVLGLTLPFVAAHPALLFLMGGVALVGLVLLALSYVAAHVDKYKNREDEEDQ